MGPGCVDGNGAMVLSAGSDAAEDSAGVAVCDMGMSSSDSKSVASCVQVDCSDGEGSDNAGAEASALTGSSKGDSMLYTAPY